MDLSSSELQTLLAEAAGGNQEAVSRLMPVVYEELRQMANRYMRREREGHTLQTTALVHEAYLKLTQEKSLRVESHAHFLGIAAQLMRWILVDYERSRRAARSLDILKLRPGGGAKLRRQILDDAGACGRHATDTRQPDQLRADSPAGGFSQIGRF